LLGDLASFSSFGSSLIRCVFFFVGCLAGVRFPKEFEVLELAVRLKLHKSPAIRSLGPPLAALRLLRFAPP
jgi:hypothetical protein